jgi:hypothetical protein
MLNRENNEEIRLLLDIRYRNSRIDDVLMNFSHQDREIAKLKFGLGGVYTYSDREIAAIFKTDTTFVESRVEEIRGHFNKAGLLSVLEIVTIKG